MSFNKLLLVETRLSYVDVVFFEGLYVLDVSRLGLAANFFAIKADFCEIDDLTVVACLLFILS